MAYDLDQAIIAFTMNGITNTVTLEIVVDETNNTITLSGAIPNMNDYNWAEGYNALQEVCGVLHEGMLWPDVDIEAIIDLDELDLEQ